MKTCKKCLREYDEQVSSGNDPASESGELFHAATAPEVTEDLCSDCRREAGILNLLGFHL